MRDFSLNKMKNKKVIYKILSFLVILTIFYFLGKNLVGHWQKVKEYDFFFNYFYLLLSFVFLLSGMLGFGLIWSKILKIIEPEKRISNFKAVRIFIYSWFGKYMPGKAWMLLGRIYLGQKEGLSKRALTLAVGYDVALSNISIFLFSLIFLGISFGRELFDYYLIPLLIIPIGLISIHPRVLYFILNLFLRKFKKIEIPLDKFLSYRDIIQIVFYFFIVYSLNGIGFFFLIRSLVYLSFYDIIGIMGAFAFAAGLGMVAIFAPSGLGVREGVLVIFLQFYFPLSIAVLISLIARIWATLGEIIIFIVIYLYSKWRKI